MAKVLTVIKHEGRGVKALMALPLTFLRLPLYMKKNIYIMYNIKYYIETKATCEIFLNKNLIFASKHISMV